jgi:hypothetical protein
MEVADSNCDDNQTSSMFDPRNSIASPITIGNLDDSPKKKGLAIGLISSRGGISL